mmetsp:Transcript_22050/g.34208  ORF Transcript_22050/g.34208 Transcript_22050/m.34208 type:complete len:218 (-) Transcript_22050:2231-2884(-)
MLTKKANAAKMRKDKHEINVDAIKEWIRSRVDQMIKVADLEIDLKSQMKSLKVVKEEIDSELEVKGSHSLYKEKLLVKKYDILALPENQQDQATLFEIDQEIDQTEVSIDQVQSTIDSLTEKQQYIELKVQEINMHVLKSDLEKDQQLSKQNLSSAEGIKALMDSFFYVLREVSVQLREINNSLEIKKNDLAQLQVDFRQVQQQKEVSEKYYEEKIE